MPRSRRKKLGKDEKFILDVLLALVIILVGIRYLPGAWLISLEWLTGNQVARIGFAIAALVFVVINFRKKRTISGAIALLPILLVLIEIYLFVPFHRSKPVPPGSETVRVLTYNNATMPTNRVLQGIAESGADIACLQEIGVTNHGKFLDSAKTYGYDGRFVLLRDDAGMGTIILSREPIVKSDTLFTSSWNEKVRRFVRVHTTVKGHPLRVISLQLESTNRKNDLYGVIESWKLRMEQAQRVKEAIIGKNTPLIVAGDFNSTPTNRAIRPLLRTFTDSWRQTGFGLGGTWHRRFPLFRIDYIMYDHLDGARNPSFIKLGPSDHRAYVVDLILPPME